MKSSYEMEENRKFEEIFTYFFLFDIWFSVRLHYIILYIDLKAKCFILDLVSVNYCLTGNFVFIIEYLPVFCVNFVMNAYEKFLIYYKSCIVE